MAPPGGHAPETLWHSEAKHSLARWAGSLPNVISAIPERTTADRARRADVLIVLGDGKRLAFEVQYRLPHDDDWRMRHDSYRASGVSDVWLWHPSLARQLPMITMTEGRPMWFLELADRRIGSVWGQAHPRRTSWFTEQDLSIYSPHQPPCRHDPLEYKALPWNKFSLDHSGPRQPQEWSQAHQSALTAIRDEADAGRREWDRRAAEKAAQLREMAQFAAAETLNRIARVQQPPTQSATAGPQTTPAPAHTPKPPPPWEIPKGVKPPICDLCPYPLTPMWWDTGRHGDCEEQRILREHASASRRGSKHPGTAAARNFPENKRTSASNQESEYQQPELPFGW